MIPSPRPTLILGLVATIHCSGTSSAEETAAEKVQRFLATKEVKRATEVLRDIERDDVKASREMLAAMEQALPRLIQLLDESRGGDEAAGLLLQFPELSLPALPVLLEHPGSAKSERWMLLRALQRLSEARLMPYSHHDDRAIRIFVIRSFARPPGYRQSDQSPLKESVLQRLRKLLKDKDALVRVEAARALGSYEAEALPSAKDLLECALAETGDELATTEGLPKGLGSVTTRKFHPGAAMLVALSRMGREVEPHVHVATESKNLELRRAAAHALRRMGPEETPQSDARLRQLARDGDAKVRWYAVSALGERSGGEGELEVVLGALEDEDWEVVRVAAQSLGKLLAREAPTGGVTIYRDRLLGLLDHERSVIGVTAAVALRAFVSEEDPVIAKARDEVRGRITVRSGELKDGGMLKIIHQLGEPAEALIALSAAEVEAQLREHDDLSEELLDGISDLTEEWKGKARALVPALINGLEMKTPPRGLAFLFRDLGSAAEEALPALRKTLKRQDLQRGFRRSIENAIEEIEEQSRD